MPSFHTTGFWGSVDYLESTDSCYAKYCNDRALRGESHFILTREAFDDVVESQKRIATDIQIEEVSDSSSESSNSSGGSGGDSSEEDDDEILTFILSCAEDKAEDDKSEVCNYEEEDVLNFTLTSEEREYYYEALRSAVASYNINNEEVNTPRFSPSPPNREIIESLLESYLEANPRAAADRGGVEEVMNMHRETLEELYAEFNIAQLEQEEPETFHAAYTFQPPSETMESYRGWISEHPHTSLTFEEYCDVIRDSHTMQSSWKPSPSTTTTTKPKQITLKNTWSGEQPYESDCSGHQVAWLRNEEDYRFIACIEELPVVNDLDLPDGVLRGIDVYRQREGTWYEQVDGKWVFEFDGKEDEVDGFCVVENEDEFDQQTLYANLTNIDLRGLDRFEQE